MGLRDRLGMGRQGPDDVLARLRDGDEVTVSCRLRRTSARGWGAWAEATLELGAPPDGEARWSTDDAIAVGFASTNERIELPFEEVSDVFLRDVRFRTEAFWGMESAIVVVASDRGTIEVAVPPAQTEALAARLVDLLRPSS